VRPNAREMARSDSRPSVRITRGAGSGQHLESVLQEGRESANIDAGLGFIWTAYVSSAHKYGEYYWCGKIAVGAVVGAVTWCAVKWHEVPDQIHAVLRAPIPFFLALLAVGAVMWAIVKWIFETQLRHVKLDIDAARLAIERIKRQVDDLISEYQIKEQKIAELEKFTPLLSQTGQNALKELANSQKRTDQTLEELDKATDQIETTLEDGSASTGGLLELSSEGEVAREHRRQRKIEKQKRARKTKAREKDLKEIDAPL